MWKFPGHASSHSTFNIFLKFYISKVQTLKFRNLKFEQNCSYIGGVDTYTLHSVDTLFNLAVRNLITVSKFSSLTKMVISGRCRICFENVSVSVLEDLNMQSWKCYCQRLITPTRKPLIFGIGVTKCGLWWELRQNGTCIKYYLFPSSEFFLCLI